MTSNKTGVSWLKQGPSVPIQIKGRRGRNSTVIYPIFTECAAISTDQYWTDVLNKASVGKLPKKIFFDGENLIYKKNRKVDTLPVSTNPNEALGQIVGFLKYYTGLISDYEREYLEQKQNTVSTEDIDYWYSWHDLKNPARVFLIANYIARLKCALSLNKFEESQLREVINYGINCHKFDTHNIIIVDAEIDKIDGLLFDRDKRVFSIDQTIVVKNVSRSRKAVDTNSNQNEVFGKKWRTFIDIYCERLRLNAVVKDGSPSSTGVGLQFTPPSVKPLQPRLIIRSENSVNNAGK